MNHESGKIYEFSDASIVVALYNPNDPDNEGSKFILKISPSTVPFILNVTWKNETYGASPEQVKQHILDAIEVARLSKYAETHELRVRIPYYPVLVVPLKRVSEVNELINKVLNNYI